MTKRTEAQAQQFNPSLLVLRRESLGLTQASLARSLKVSQATLSRIEAGLGEPSPSLLSAISRELHRPAQFFFQQEPVYGPGVSEFHHRMRQSVGARSIKQAHARIGEDLITLRRLLRSAELDTSGFDNLRNLEELASPEDAARAVRAAWHLPAGPVNSVTECTERAGGIVIPTDFGSLKIDAISRWAPDLPPVFFVNREIPGDRQRLSIAHELGHMFLHHAPSPEMETEASRFAAELLMPARDIKHQLGNVTLENLAALKPVWKVSMQALLYRATELKMLDKRRARYLWMRMGHLGYRRTEPAEMDVPRERATTFQELLDLHRKHFRFTLDQLRELLLLDLDEIKNRYLVQFDTSIDGKPNMRLVR